MNETNFLIQNYISVARERFIVAFLIIISAIHFDLLPPPFFSIIAFGAIIHIVQMYFVNLSAQLIDAHENTEKIIYFLKWLNGISIGYQITLILSISIYMALL